MSHKWIRRRALFVVAAWPTLNFVWRPPDLLLLTPLWPLVNHDAPGTDMAPFCRRVANPLSFGHWAYKVECSHGVSTCVMLTPGTWMTSGQITLVKNYKTLIILYKSQKDIRIHRYQLPQCAVQGRPDSSTVSLYVCLHVLWALRQHREWCICLLLESHVAPNSPYV